MLKTRKIFSYLTDPEESFHASLLNFLEKEKKREEKWEKM